jgi:hypothetical protein
MNVKSCYKNSDLTYSMLVKLRLGMNFIFYRPKSTQPNDSRTAGIETLRNNILTDKQILGNIKIIQ